MIKRIGMCISIALFALAFMGASFYNIPSVNQKVIVIDAGHGGVDGGSVGKFSGEKESDINLIIAKKLQKLCENSGVKVIMTRSTQDGLYGDKTQGFKSRDMRKRKQIISESNANLVVSVHCNMCEVEYRFGAIVFYPKGNEQAKQLAVNVQTEVNGLYENPRDLCRSGDFYILNCTTAPSILVECGFLSNRKEEALLQNPTHQQKLAQAIYNGIFSYWGI